MREEGIPPHHHPETPQAIKRKLSDFKETPLKEGGLSEFVCRDTFCTFGPKLKNIDRGGGGGGKSIQFRKGLFNGSPKVSVAEP